MQELKKNILKNLQKRFGFLSLLIGLSFVVDNASAQEINYAQKVNTMIGTKGKGWSAGYVYPGATYPFGMVQFTRSYFSKQSGFAINQLSGAGCDHMGNFPLLPLKGKLTVSPDSMINLRADIANEKGIAGLYTATVDNDIQAAFTVTERTGMARFDYPASAESATIAIAGGVAGTAINVASIVVTSKHSCEGFAEGGSFCGISTPYKVYFVAEFDADAETFGTWKNETLHNNESFAEGKHSGVYFTFNTGAKKTIQYKVGVSYVSVENARKNLQQENSGFDFAAVSNKAINEWNKYLGKIAVKGSNDNRIEQFYTHLYHSLIHPNICSDVNGEYMGADNKVYTSRDKVYTSLSNWDTYRTQIQLLSLLAPDVASDVVNSHQLFAMQSGGGFPRWVMANIETGIMQGDPTSILISNAWAFGARNYDTRSILRTMQHGGEKPEAHSQNELTRPGLKQYMDKGFYSASMQLEYTSADFAIAQYALHACNDEPVNWYYNQRAQSWQNLYNPATKWLQSRNADGSWKRYNEDWREATFKNYFWMVPFNLKKLIDTIGGKTVAEKRLDSLFVRLDASYNDEWYAAGNEPDFQIPWIYNWTNAPHKSQAIIRRILNEQFSSKENGLPGNDDLGAMGSWYVFACLGMYPEIPGVGGFSINGPIFSSVVLKLDKGTVTITGGDENRSYIQSLMLNGKPYESTWLPLDKIQNGATLEYKMSNKASGWGKAIEPPSFN